jgi:hypothetical protein
MTKPREYEIKSTHLPGIELRVLKGFKPKVPKEVIELLLARARVYAQADMEIEQKKSQQETRKPEIIDFIEAMPGLRGIRSVEEDWDLLVVERQTSPSYNSVLLRESLGPILFPEIVGEEIVASLTCSAKHHNPRRASAINLCAF